MADDKVVIEDRWCLTEDKSRVVPEDSVDARWLLWIPGDEVPRADAERLGVVAKDPEPEKAPVRRKPGRPPGSKNRTPEENK